MRPVARENRRRYVNVFLAIWLAVLAIDAFRPINDAHRWLDDQVLDIPLDVTGLWQGSWPLFRDVPRDNLHLSARIEFADGTTATWDAPVWSSLGPLQKLVRAREMNYFRNILRAGQEPAWDGLAQYLARTVPHPGGGTAVPTTVTLVLQGATIPPLESGVVPAGPWLQWDPPNPIWVWRRP